MQEGSLKKRKMAKELSDLVTVCQSVRFHDFQTAQQEGKDITSHSINLVFYLLFMFEVTFPVTAY